MAFNRSWGSPGGEAEFTYRGCDGEGDLYTPDVVEGGGGASAHLRQGGPQSPIGAALLGLVHPPGARRETNSTVERALGPGRSGGGSAKGRTDAFRRGPSLSVELKPEPGIRR